MIEPLIPGAWTITPVIHGDEGRMFAEICRFADLPTPFTLEQLSVSVSAKGSVRGIHYAAGQAKLVTCVSGAILDVAVDLRAGSPTYGQWSSVVLDDKDRRAVYLAADMGHGFCALTDNATILYAVAPVYNPATEREIHPLDATLGIPWPTDDPKLSDRDANAPSFVGGRS